MIKTVIIDDEENARKLISAIIAKHASNIELCGEADSVENGVSLISTQKPELVILDIQLGDGTAFDLLKLIPNINFKIIFVSAYQEFAIEAFKFSAIDYVLKPVSPQSIITAIEKAGEKLNLEEIKLKVESLSYNFSASNESKKLLLRTSDSIYLLDTKEIIRCESEGSYTTFFTTDNRKLIVSKGIKEYDDLLCSYGFFRIHQSHLINMSCFKEYNKRDDVAVLKDNSRIPVATRKKEQLLKLLENI